MAKKAARRGANKSQAIRDYLKENPDAGPSAVASALNAREGWKISPAYVSTIKNKTKSSGGRGRAGRRAGRPATKSGSVSQEALLQAHELAKRAGGINQAKAALELLARLSS